MIKKIIALGVTAVMVLALGACGNKYNAIVVDSELAFREEFLKESMTYGAYYKNENWDAEDEESDEYLLDETSPNFRTFIIAEKDKLDEVFTIFPQIDFEKEMVVMYAYTSTNGRSRKIKKTKLNEKTLTIEFNTEKAKFGYNDASMPQRRFLVIKMQRLNVTAVEFIKL